MFEMQITPKNLSNTNEEKDIQLPYQTSAFP